MFNCKNTIYTKHQERPKVGRKIPINRKKGSKNTVKKLRRPRLHRLRSDSVQTFR
jgi:hypothetical protein